MSYRLETHYHTSESSPCATVNARQGLQVYTQSGYQGIVITDHFSRSALGIPAGQQWEEVVSLFLRGYRTAKGYQQIYDIDVYLGMEIRFPYNEDDFLIYGLSEDFLFENPWLYEMDLAGFSKLAHQAGLFIVQAHPFRPGSCRANPLLLDGIEVYNGNPRHDSHNAFAEKWCQKHCLRPLSGSDYHEPDDLNQGGVLLPYHPEKEINIANMLSQGIYELVQPLADYQTCKN